MGCEIAGSVLKYNSAQAKSFAPFWHLPVEEHNAKIEDRLGSDKCCGRRDGACRVRRIAAADWLTDDRAE
jgi:hypothetical protein